jgi:DNA polymerase-1
MKGDGLRIQTHRVAGDEVTIRVTETLDDLDRFADWVRFVGRRVVAFDTETTGLDVFSTGFRLRVAQFGTAREAWVIPVDRLCLPEPYASAALDAASRALRSLPRVTIHNAPFDSIVASEHMLGVDLVELWSRVTDTAILCHLCDPRGPEDGGPGLSLKTNSARRVDPNAPDTANGLTAVFRSLGHTKATGWEAIPIDHPTYTLYAGLDVILGARLHESLAAEVANRGFDRLAEFEHAVARICTQMEALGVRVDPEYLEQLRDTLAAEYDAQAALALAYGVRSVNAPAQVSAALLGMGEELTELTDAGNLSVDKEVLMPLADLDREWQRVGAREPNPLADAVLRAKRAGKWRTSYAEAMLARRDADDRIHPSIASLKARTARMSISRPALQQLPAGDWVIRRALIAEEAGVFGSVDYAAVEMRILAALAADPVMMRAIHEGRDLHDFTAELLYGPEFTKFHRKVAKGIGFGKVYGGGAETLSRQTGAPLGQVKAALREYDRQYRAVKRYSSRLVSRAEYGRREVVTPAGRVLPLDRRRLYAAVNYMVQSTARDVLAQALLDMDAKGLTPYLRLPIHDEVVFTAPKDIAGEVGRSIADTMRVPDFFGVPLDTDLEIGGRSWGSLYGAAA